MEQVIAQPEYDASGFLEWTDEVERIFQRANAGGQAVALLQTEDGTVPVLLFGLLRSGEHREWVARMSMVPSATDYPMRYALNLLDPGEERGQKMYPRLRRDDRSTGIIAEPGEIMGILQRRVAFVDRISEEAHVKASTDTAIHMKGLMGELLKPKPWWRFW